MDQIIGFINNGEGERELAVSAENPLPVTASVTVEPAPPAPVDPSVTTKATFVQGSKLPAAIGTPEALAASGTYVSFVTIIGQRLARVANANSVFIGSTSANNSQLVELTPGGTVPGVNGSSFSLTAPPGRVIDLGDIYVDILDAGDGVTYWGML